jgi:hypothetical protein
MVSDLDQQSAFWLFTKTKTVAHGERNKISLDNWKLARLGRRKMTHAND